MNNRNINKRNSEPIKAHGDLMTQCKQSHNEALEDERIIALIKFLARCAAEEDFALYQNALASSKNIEGE